MSRIVITLHPASSEDGLLRVSDAMEQVLDLLRLHNEARRGVAATHQPFEWRLERASANSPFQLTALADPAIPGAAVEEYSEAVNREFTKTLDELINQGRAQWWMDPDALSLAQRVLARSQNGIAVTEVNADSAPPLVIDRQRAEAGLQTITRVGVVSLEASTAEGVAWGEVSGVFFGAGTWYRRPSISIQSEQYGRISCILTPDIVKDFGHELRLEDVWSGKTLGVEGQLIYSPTGGVSRILASHVRVVAEAPLVSIDAIVDSDFTDGLDPVEYLRRLHEGELA